MEKLQVDHCSRPILVTGSHRSGSTWVGRMLAAAPRVTYVHEPFNLRADVGVAPELFKHWFLHVCNENAEEYAPALDRIIRRKYPKRPPGLKAGRVHVLARAARDHGLSLLRRARGDRVLVKDPIALFSAEWLSGRFDMDVLVITRNPAAFCSSLKIKNWQFDFNNFLEQPLLMEGYLYPFEGEIREYAENRRDVIDQAILLWNCIHHTIRIYRNKHPDWLFVRHEELSADPVARFRAIYETLGLGYTKKAEDRILESSGAHNPAEQGGGDDFMRNSRASLENWRTRLTPGEIRRIRNGTDGIVESFYGDMVW